MEEDEKPKRLVDNTNKIARAAVADAISQFSSWRRDLAQFAAMAERTFSRAEMDTMAARCSAIKEAVQLVRVDLIIALEEAPQSVAGHSRVGDVEKSLDGVEASANAVLKKLLQAPRVWRGTGRGDGEVAQP